MTPLPLRSGRIETALYDRSYIANLRAIIRQEFYELFRREGFNLHPSGPLIPEQDDSVLFTGSTISTFKPYLRSRQIPSGGFHIIQSCLRTQNTKLIDDDRQPQWGSYFSSIGALSGPQDLDRVSACIFRFFTERLEVPANRFIVRISSKDVDLLRFWNISELPCVLEKDSKEPGYYRHKFGMAPIAGRNCNLAIVDQATCEVRDIGNIIVIEDQEGAIGVELAFGVETIASRLLGMPHPISASLIADIVPATNQYSLKLADAIASAVVILETGERPFVTNRGRVLRKYLQGISKLRAKAQVCLAQIGAYASQFEQIEFGSESKIVEDLQEYLAVYEELSRPELGFSSEQVNKRLASRLASGGVVTPRKPRLPLSVTEFLPVLGISE